MKKALAFLLTVLLVAALFVGCGNTEKPAETTEAPAATEPVPEGNYVTINGQNVTIGIPFAEVSDKLGEEIRPSETIDSCDPNSDWKQTMHFYTGVTVTEDKDGLIDSIQISEAGILFNGQLQVGMTSEEVIAVLGEPVTPQPWGLYYEDSNPYTYFSMDEDTGIIVGIFMNNANS